MGRLHLLLLLFVSWVIASILVALGFDADVPVFISLLLLFISFFILVKVAPFSTMGPALYFVWLLLALPLFSVAEYLESDWMDHERIWGLTPISYMFQLPLVEKSLLIGVLAVYSFLMGLLFTNCLLEKIIFPLKVRDHVFRSLPSWVLYLLLVVALGSLMLLSPSGNIFTVSYLSLAQADAASSSATLYIFFYVLLVFLFIESKMKGDRKASWVILIGVLIYVVFFQFLKGNRECVSLILAFSYISYLFASSNSAIRRPLSWVYLGIAFVFLFGLLGVARGVLFNDTSMNVNVVDILTHGTWSAIMLTQLSIVGDVHYGVKDFLLGSSYYYEMLSIVPSGLGEAIGYDRPDDSLYNLATQVSDGLGGIYLPAAMYWNFSTVGVLVEMFVLGVLFYFISNQAAKKKDIFIVFSASMVTVLPHWFWYGEMSLIRGVQSFIVIWFIFLFLRLMYGKIGSSGDK